MNREYYFNFKINAMGKIVNNVMSYPWYCFLNCHCTVENNTIHSTNHSKQTIDVIINDGLKYNEIQKMVIFKINSFIKNIKYEKQMVDKI